MAGVFDATSYFTRRQADLRYVHSPLTAGEISSLFSEDGVGTFPGSFVTPGTITGLEIHDEAIGLQHMLGDSRPSKVIPATDPKPILPDPLFPVGSTIMWMADGGRLWINRDNANWELLVRTVDLSGKITADQVSQNIKPILPVTALPTLNINTGTVPPTITDALTHVPYHVGDLIMLTATSKLYQLFDDGGGIYHWDPVIRSGANISAGEISALQLRVDLVQSAVLSSAYLKAANASFGIVTVDQLGVGNASIDNLVAGKIQATMANFTSLNGDSANLNWITAGMVKAGAITTDKLIVGSFDSMVEDGSFTLPGTSGSWSNASPDSMQVHPNAAHPDATLSRTATGYAAVKSVGAGWSANADSFLSNRMVFDVKAGEKVAAEGWAKAPGANGIAYLVVQFFKDRGCTVAATPNVPVGTGDLWAPITAATAGSSYTFWTGTAKAPADARFARFGIYIQLHTAGTWAVDDVYVRKLVSSAYIDDLTADHIKTGTLDCTGLTVVHLDAGSITAGTLNCDSITVTNINGASVKDNTLSGAAVVAGTLSASKITTGTLSADRISGGSIDANNVTITNLNASNITAGTLSATKISGGTLNFASITCSNLTITGGQVTSAVANATNANSANTANSANSANSVPAAGVGSGALNGTTTISGGQINTGSMNADRIIAGTITTDRMSAGTINGDRISAGTLNADRIVAGSITGDRIAAGTINGDRIIAGTIDAAKINVSTLNVQNLGGWQGGFINVGSSGLTFTNGSTQLLAVFSSGIVMLGSSSATTVTPTGISTAGGIACAGFNPFVGGTQYNGQSYDLGISGGQLTLNGIGVSKVVFKGGCFVGSY